LWRLGNVSCGLISPGKGRDPLTMVWRLKKKQPWYPLDMLGVPLSTPV
jgi:hypothetical protein